jgi:hypothetical protein
MSSLVCALHRHRLEETTQRAGINLFPAALTRQILQDMMFRNHSRTYKTADDGMKECAALRQPGIRMLSHTERVAVGVGQIQA